MIILQLIIAFLLIGWGYGMVIEGIKDDIKDEIRGEHYPREYTP